eukprot:306766_1
MSRRSEIECYECNILISQLSIEYWHCPSVQLSERGVIGRDLCCVCGIKTMLKQDQARQRQTETAIDIETTTLGRTKDDGEKYQNHSRYQTAKIEEMMASLLK